MRGASEENWIVQKIQRDWVKEIESVRFNQCSSMKLNVKYYTDTENRVECGLPWVNECHEP